VSPPLTPAEIVKATIHGERPRKRNATQEEPVVAIMLHLDRERVRRFATGMGAKNLDGFIEAINAGNLWRFARRPLDLQKLAEFWRINGRLGSLEEMIETSLRERLNETGAYRRHQDALDEDKAFRALGRIGAALVLGRKTTIAIPDTEIASSEGTASIDLAQILPEWPPAIVPHC